MFSKAFRRFRPSHFRRLALPEWVALTTWKSLRSDIFAGLTGAAIVLPQAVAFAAIAGLPPQYGFYTAMVPTVVAALSGSSLHAVSGPTTAISVLVYGALSGKLAAGSADFIEAAIALAFMVGVIQVLMGLARLGRLVDFVSHSVMLGFVTGAGVLIGLSQIGPAMGLHLPRPEHLTEFFSALVDGLHGVEKTSVLIALSTCATGALIRYLRPTWPAFLIALFAGTLLYLLLGGASTSVRTIGAMPEVAPKMQLPAVSLIMLNDFGSAALAIAIVGLLEAMSISRGLALRSGQNINANREFVGQGLSNVAGSFFQCYPSSASFTRSGANFDAGAQTPLSAVFAALFLFLILLFAAPVLAYIPTPAMAGVILLVAWNLLDWQKLRHLYNSSRTESWIAGLTFSTAVLVELELAIYVGVLLSLGLFINRTAHPFVGIGAPDQSTPRRVFLPAVPNRLPECPQLIVSRIDGPLYFGSVEFIRRELRRIEDERPEQTYMLMVLIGIGEIDLAGAELLIEEARRRRKRGGALAIHAKTPRTIERLTRFGVPRDLFGGVIYKSKGEALAQLVPLMADDPCKVCRLRIFLECSQRPGLGMLSPAELRAKDDLPPLSITGGQS